MALSASFRWGGRIDSAAFTLFLAVLVWAPIPLASNRAWAVSLLTVLLCALLVLVLSAQAWGAPISPPASRWPERRAWIPVLALGALLLLLVVQLLAMPLPFRALLVPGAAEAGPVSVDVFATRRYLLTSLAYVSAFLLVLLLVRSEVRIRKLCLCIVASGTLQAVIGIFLLSTQGSVSFMFSTLNPNLRASGTFPNPDHLAGYLELCLAAGVGLMLWGVGAADAATRGWQARVVWLLQLLLSNTMLLRLLLIAMVIALVLTRSRMGNAAFLLSLLITGAVCAVQSKRLRRMAVTLIISILLVDIIVIGQWVGLDKLVERLEATSTQREVTEPSPGPGVTPVARSRQEESLEERLQAARYALAMPLARPWLGFGGGTFYAAFMPFKGPHPLTFYDHAHDDYVEVAADTGLVGLGLLAAVVLSSAWRAFRSINDRGSALSRGVALGIFMAICSIAIHSVVDFNLQIPANALTVTVLLALAWRLPGTDRKPSRRRSSRDSETVRADSPRTATRSRDARPTPSGARVRMTRRAPADIAFLAVAAGVLVWVADFGTGQMRSDIATMAARERISRCAETYPTWAPDDWTETEADMARGIGIEPANPVLHDVMAQLHTCHALAVWGDRDAAAAMFARVRDESEASLALRADYAPALVSLATALRLTDAPSDAVNTAWLAALRNAPHEPRLDAAMMDVALRGWIEATPAMHEWAVVHFKAASTKEQATWTALAQALGLDIGALVR